ncbi:MAG: hypothetical protein ACYCPT_13180, partial [Acidimicrobiales bacterium]
HQADYQKKIAEDKIKAEHKVLATKIKSAITKYVRSVQKLNKNKDIVLPEPFTINDIEEPDEVVEETESSKLPASTDSTESTKTKKPSTIVFKSIIDKLCAHVKKTYKNGELSEYIIADVLKVFLDDVLKELTAIITNYFIIVVDEINGVKTISMDNVVG